jgi:hypothetical protein
MKTSINENNNVNLLKNNRAIKINNDYFKILDDIVPLKELKNIEAEIVKGIVKSKKYWEPNLIFNKNCLYDQNFIEAYPYFSENYKLTDEYKYIAATGITDEEIYDIMKFLYPVTEISVKRLFLRKSPLYYKSFALKHREKANKDQICLQHFSELVRWINKSNIFDEVGRIVIFVNETGDTIPIHSDYADGETRKDQFLWINFNRKKKFFILDENCNKVYSDGEIVIFDNANWHGSEPSEHACFTIRIDGIFKQSFLEKSDLLSYFNDK